VADVCAPSPAARAGRVRLNGQGLLADDPVAAAHERIGPTAARDQAMQSMNIGTIAGGKLWADPKEAEAPHR